MKRNLALACCLIALSLVAVPVFAVETFGPSSNPNTTPVWGFTLIHHFNEAGDLIATQAIHYKDNDRSGSLTKADTIVFEDWLHYRS